MKHFPHGKYEALLRCMKRDPNGSHVFLPRKSIKFLPIYFRFNRKYVDYKQVASGMIIVFHCDGKNIVLRGIGLVLCGYSTKLANNGK